MTRDDLLRAAWGAVEHGLSVGDGAAAVLAERVTKRYLRWLLGTSKAGMARWRLGVGQIVQVIVVEQPDAVYLCDENVEPTEAEAQVFAHRMGDPIGRADRVRTHYTKVRNRLADMLQCDSAEVPEPLLVLAWQYYVMLRAKRGVTNSPEVRTCGS